MRLRLVGLCLLLSGCFLFGPQLRPASTEVVERTPARLERGRYLVEHVSACLFCHSKHDWTRYTGTLVPGSEGGGGVCLDGKDDVPGTMCTENISSHPDGLGEWTDGEVMRAIREGVSRDGRTLFPWMPYAYYRSMSDEDARAMVVYLRGLPPVAGKPPATKISWPVSALINTLPEPLHGPVPDPPANDPLARGKYLATLATCDYCHTNQPRGRRTEGRDFAGGFSLHGPWGQVVSPNLTPHETGLGRFTREEFVARMKSWESFDQTAPAMPSGATIMPWTQLAGMTEEDLGLIYDWLKTFPPVENRVAPFGPFDGGS